MRNHCQISRHASSLPYSYPLVMIVHLPLDPRISRLLNATEFGRVRDSKTSPHGSQNLSLVTDACLVSVLRQFVFSRTSWLSNSNTMSQQESHPEQKVYSVIPSMHTIVNACPRFQFHSQPGYPYHVFAQSLASWHLNMLMALETYLSPLIRPDPAMTRYDMAAINSEPSIVQRQTRSPPGCAQ